MEALELVDERLREEAPEYTENLSDLDVDPPQTEKSVVQATRVSAMRSLCPGGHAASPQESH